MSLIKSLCFSICVCLLMVSCDDENGINLKPTQYIFNKASFPTIVNYQGNVYQKKFVLGQYETHARMQNKMPLDSNTYEFPYIPVTIMAADLDLDGLNCQLGYVDRNKNGSFSDIGIDQLVIIPNGVDSIHMVQYGPICYVRDTMYVALDNRKYQVVIGDNQVINLDRRVDSTKQMDIIFNSKIPDMQVVNVSNQSVPLRSFKEDGKKLMVVFWSNHRQSCLKSFQNIEKKQWTDRTIIGLNITDDVASLTQYAQLNDIHWPLVLGEKSQLVALGNLGLYPSAILYDEQGNVEDFHYVWR